MVSFPSVVAGFAGLLVVYSLVRYLGSAHNNLVEARQNVDRTWGNVETLLQRRHDEVASLVAVAREHVDVEQEVLAEVLVARERLVEADTPSQRALAEVEVKRAVDEIYNLADDYPELRADEHFAELGETITELERRLEDRREYYNEAVARYNARLDRFPESLFASRRDYEPREPFSADEEARERVDIREQFAR
ncbi:LemA family protein [Salinirubellus salinus]|uniref:LemA family protein n=1 Tax=Salinirubellus salinus TaxID=1364945 RepID=A0A9E7QZJ2_9EURY|nr:LemA family protein [Salinirubellus salinus]UWM52916.1 LemA family protein [Salinirubellus salinus]